MKFEWDESKNIINKQKHNISFETARHILETSTMTKEDEIREAEDVVKYPITFDEDCPELSPAMMKAFRSAVVQRNRRKNA